MLTKKIVEFNLNEILSQQAYNKITFILPKKI